MTDRISIRLAKLRDGAKAPSLGLRLRASDGFALPTALLMLLAATAVVTAGLVGSMQVIAGTDRDQDTKSAIGLAESGAAQALLHFNRIPETGNPCSPVSASGPDGSGWCPAVAGNLAGGTYSFRVRPSTVSGPCPDPSSASSARRLEIVATGGDGGATRRIQEIACSSSGTSVFSSASVLAQDGIHLDSNADVTANMATGGSIALDSNSHVCGDTFHGVGGSVTLTGNATHTCGITAEAPLTLPPVNQGDAATNNDNNRFFSLDQVTGTKADVCWNGLKGDGTAGTCGARELRIGQKTAVTLGGSKYSFCKLYLESNSALYIAPGATVTIYFDSPEACGYSSGVNQLEMASNSNTRISASGGGAANIALLFVGSLTRQTNILMNSNTEGNPTCAQGFVLYAPLSNVTLNSNSTYCGGIAGKSVEIDANAHVASTSDTSTFQLPNTASHYEVERFVECQPVGSGAPNGGC